MEQVLIPAATVLAFSAAIALCAVGASMFALIATWLWSASPFEKAAWIFLIVGTVGALLGSESSPLRTVCMLSVGAAIAMSAAAATVAAIAGRRSTGLRIAFQNRFSPLWRRRRPEVGSLAFPALAAGWASKA